MKPGLTQSSAGMGEARVELLFRSLECRLLHLPLQPGAIRREENPGDDRAVRRHNVMRAAHRLARPNPGRSCRLPRQAARPHQRRRAA